MTSCRIFRKSGFSLKESVEGGSLDVTPMAVLGLTDSEDKSDKV
jgi:hypothetical protein